MNDTRTRIYTTSTKSAGLPPRVIRFVGSDESVDRDGDTISIDGWDVAAYNKNPVVLYGHDYYGLPIGRAVVSIDKRARQLLFDITFPTVAELSTDPAMPSEHALKVDAIYNMAKAGILNTVSVGFRGLEYDRTDTGLAYKKQELMEVSIVPVPANPNAIAVLRAAGAVDSVIKGVTMQVEKGNRRLSKASRDVLMGCHDALVKTVASLKSFIDEGEMDEDTDDEKVGNPHVGEEIGADANEQQPEKQYVIELVEKNSAASTKGKE